MADAFSETVVEESPGTMTLKVIQGKGQGKKYALAEGRGMVIGRMQDSDIPIDPADKLASRQHARITRQGEGALLEDLGSGNGTFVGDEKISQHLLQAGAVFRIGGTTFLLELQCPQEAANVTMYLDSEKPVPKGGSKVRVFLLGLLLVCMLCVLFILFFSGKDPEKAEQKVEPSITQTEQVEPLEPPAQAAAKPAEPAPVAAEPAAVEQPEIRASQRTSPDTATADASGRSGARKKESQDHFRQGRFFYNTGNLEKAVDEWNLAYNLDPDNQATKKWLLRAEQELDEQIDTHYRLGLKAKKYMRYTDARNEFKLVVKWSRDKDDERYLDAVKQLEELKDK